MSKKNLDELECGLTKACTGRHTYSTYNSEKDFIHSSQFLTI